MYACWISSDETDLCSLPVEVGPCRGYFPKWFYNSTSQRCEKFIYGGCQGNENRFETRELCESACVCGKFYLQIVQLPTVEGNFCLQQIRVLFSQKPDHAGQQFPVTSTTSHLATVNCSLMVAVVVMTIGLKQLLNVLNNVSGTVSV